MVFSVCDVSTVPGQSRNGTQSASALLAVPTHNFIKALSASGTCGPLDEPRFGRIAEVEDVLTMLLSGIQKNGPAQVLVVDRGGHGANTTAPGDKHHVLGRAASVPGYRQRRVR